MLELAEASQAVLDGIKNADFLAYSANFASYGNGGGGTDYLQESYKAMQTTLATYRDLLGILQLEVPAKP